MSSIQPGIIAPLPEHARFLSYRLKPGVDPTTVFGKLSRAANGTEAVVGIGHSLVLALGKSIQGLKTFSGYAGPGVDLPSTPHALWLWLRDAERGSLILRQRTLDALLAPAFAQVSSDEGFFYRGRDLSGYEDGTENPKGDEITEVAAISGSGPGLDGSSLVAVQHWIHDLDGLATLNSHTRDELIGRRISDNGEMDDAPESAHVKRTAQEDFDPEAFVWRRSMPWSDATRAGFMYIAFARDFYAFEVQLQRMSGVEDGITDGLFRYSHPVGCAYYWCPPMSKSGGLDLSALGIQADSR
jgi:putative iron-dependent peroxidase